MFFEPSGEILYSKMVFRHLYCNFRFLTLRNIEPVARQIQRESLSQQSSPFVAIYKRMSLANRLHEGSGFCKRR